MVGPEIKIPASIRAVEDLAKQWGTLARRFGQDVVEGVTKGVQGNPAAVRQALKDLEELVKPIQSYRGSRASQRLPEDKNVAAVLKKIFVDNMEDSKILSRVNPQELLADLRACAELPSFVPTLKQLKKYDVAIKGYVATVQETAKDIRRLGQFDPAKNANGVRDINVNVYNSKGKKIDDFDLVSEGTVWEIKVGKLHNWNSPDLGGWIDLAAEYAKKNGMTQIGFRLDAIGMQKFNSTAFKKVLGEKKAQYAHDGIVFLDPVTIPSPPIP